MPVLKATYSRILRATRKSIMRGCMLLALVFSIQTFLYGQKPSTPEYQVKAVFLLNFTEFVEWPETVFAKADDPFVIGILGNDPFGKYLDELIAGEKVNEHPIVIRRFKTATEIDRCHVLFLSSLEKGNVGEILDEAKSRQILTVSDMPNFVKQGGMIRFYLEQNKIRIRINLDVVKQTDLTISSKLLRVAEVVESQP